MMQQSKSCDVAEPSASCGQSDFARNLRYLRKSAALCFALNSILFLMTSASAQEITAQYVGQPLALDAAYPAKAWSTAEPVVFSSDWQGKNPDPSRETIVKALWSNGTLYLRFECRYRDIYVFGDSDPNGRRDQLWDRDVVEAFLQPDSSRENYYREFEVAPNSMWVDLDIFPGGRSDLKSGMKRSVYLDRQGHSWDAELAIPMKSLTEHFDPQATWRVNFYRVEGQAEPRAYLAWQPTNTAQPNFHLPSAFGRMKFELPPKHP
jgi:hypothetical protein